MKNPVKVELMFTEPAEKKYQIIFGVALLLVIISTIVLSLTSKPVPELTSEKEKPRTFTPEEAGLVRPSPTSPPLSQEETERMTEEIIETGREGPLEVKIEYKDGRVVPITPAGSCSKLIKIISPQIFEKTPNLPGDVNHDGRVDLEDLGIVHSKITDEKWCQEMLSQK